MPCQVDELKPRHWNTVSEGPSKVTSSMYANLRGLPSDINRGWIDKQNKIGPNGSPCWAPSSDVKMCSPNQRTDDLLYAKWQNLYSCGLPRPRAVSRLRQLNALLKSILTSVQSSGISASSLRAASHLTTLHCLQKLRLYIV